MRSRLRGGGTAFALTRGSDGERQHERGRLPASRPDADAAPRPRGEAPGDLRALRRGALGKGAPALRCRGVSRVPALRGAGPRLRSSALRGVSS
ncbi:MAG: hypothetical protein ACK559_25870, partial [bacterium]